MAEELDRQDEDEVEAHKRPPGGAPVEGESGWRVGRTDDDDEDEVEAHKRPPGGGAPEDPEARVG